MHRASESSLSGRTAYAEVFRHVRQCVLGVSVLKSDAWGVQRHV